MQSLYFAGPNRLEWRDAPAPVLTDARDALVRPLAGAACDLDAAVIAGLTPYAPPFPLGHELAGEVADAGEDAGVTPGQRVIVPFQISCGRCAFCQRGLTANCTSVPRTSMFGIGEKGGGWGGAFSELVRVPFADHMLMALPETLSPSIAARLGDNVADGYRAVADGLRDLPAAPVAVLCGGLKGSVPLYAASAAVTLGSERVDFYDSDPRRLAVAESVGAAPHHVDAWPKRLGSYPITVDATQDPAGLSCALRSTEPGGTCTSTSMYFEPLVGVPMTEMYMKGVRLVTGRAQSRALLPEVLDLVATGRLAPERVPADVVAWNDLDRALLDFETKLVAVHDS